MNNNEYLVGVYKEVGKNPDIIKIKNDKVYLEKLLDGEYANQDYDDYTILYKKQNDNLLANIYVDQYSKIGISLKGKVFAVAKDENGNFKSLNKEQAKKCITFFLREAFNYKNFDENGKYIPRSKRKNKNIFKNQTQEKQETKQVQEKAVQEEQPQPQKVNITDMAKALNVSNEFFEKNFRVEKIEANKEENNTSKSNENANTDTKQQNSTNASQPPIIKLSDEQTLNMILKITFIILDFVRGALEETEDDE